MTVMGDASRDRLPDAGSIPARSMKKVPYLQALFLLCAEHGTNLAGESPVTGIYRQV